MTRSNKGPALCETSVMEQVKNHSKDKGENNRQNNRQNNVLFYHPLPSLQWEPGDWFDPTIQKTNFWFDRMLVAPHQRFRFA